MTAEQDARQRFFDFLGFDSSNYIEFRTNDPLTGVWRNYHWAGASQPATSFNPAADGMNWYFGVQPRLRYNSFASHADNVGINNDMLWADLDFKSGATLDNILRSPFPNPNVIVYSGGGYHLYWKLDGQSTIEVRRAAMHYIARVMGGDSVDDPARLLRVPYSLNYKYYPPVMTRILRFDSKTRHNLGDFLPLSKPFPTLAASSNIPYVVKAKKGTRSEGLYSKTISGILAGHSKRAIYNDLLASPDGSKLTEMRTEDQRQKWFDTTYENAKKNLSKQGKP